MLRPIAQRVLLFTWLTTAGLLCGQDKKQDPNELLDKATEKKLQAKSTADLEAAAKLCEQALAAGLKGEDSDFAKELLAAALFQKAEELRNQMAAKLARRQNDWRELLNTAMADLDRILKYRKDLGDVHLLRAQLNLLPGGSRAKARESAKEAVKLLKDDKAKLSDAYTIRGSLERTPKKQLADYREALKFNPDNSRARRALGTALLLSNKIEDAVKEFKRLIDDNPADANSLMAIIQSLTQLKKYKEAIQFVDKLIAIRPDATLGYELRARIHVAREDNDAAIKDLSQALDINPLDADSRALRGRLYYEKKTYDKALIDADELVRLRPSTPDGYLLRASILEQQKKYQEAIRDARRLRRMDPENEQFILILGDLLYRNKQVEASIELYTDFQKRNSKSWLAVYARGDLYLNIGKHAEAIKDYERALKLNASRSDGILNNFAWVLATTPDDKLRDGKRAIELATKACKLTNYEKPHILSTLAAGYAEIGDWENALKWSRKAVEMETRPTNKKGLQEEVDQYLKKKPWRERKTPEDEDGKIVDEEDGKKKDGKEKDGKEKDGKEKDSKKSETKADKKEASKPETSKEAKK